MSDPIDTITGLVPRRNKHNATDAPVSGHKRILQALACEVLELEYRMRYFLDDHDRLALRKLVEECQTVLDETGFTPARQKQDAPPTPFDPADPIIAMTVAALAKHSLPEATTRYENHVRPYVGEGKSAEMPILTAEETRKALVAGRQIGKQRITAAQHGIDLTAEQDRLIAKTLNFSRQYGASNTVSDRYKSDGNEASITAQDTDYFTQQAGRAMRSLSHDANLTIYTTERPSYIAVLKRAVVFDSYLYFDRVQTINWFTEYYTTLVKPGMVICVKSTLADYLARAIGRHDKRPIRIISISDAIDAALRGEV